LLLPLLLLLLLPLPLPLPLLSPLPFFLPFRATRGTCFQRPKGQRPAPTPPPKQKAGHLGPPSTPYSLLSTLCLYRR
jgi:hypothetical protein